MFVQYQWSLQKMVQEQLLESDVWQNMSRTDQQNQLLQKRQINDSHNSSSEDEFISFFCHICLRGAQPAAQQCPGFWTNLYHHMLAVESPAGVFQEARPLTQEDRPQNVCQDATKQGTKLWTAAHWLLIRKWTEIFGSSDVKQGDTERN